MSTIVRFVMTFNRQMCSECQFPLVHVSMCNYQLNGNSDIHSYKYTCTYMSKRNAIFTKFTSKSPKAKRSSITDQRSAITVMVTARDAWRETFFTLRDRKNLFAASAIHCSQLNVEVALMGDDYSMSQRWLIAAHLSAYKLTNMRIYTCILMHIVYTVTDTWMLYGYGGCV